ncbi:MAG: hypothetical protein V4467_00310 [Patescibacteria group bacterium]
MASRSKIRVGVVRGGKSKRHHHSLKTGSQVLKSLPENYAPVDVFIDQAGVWHIHGVAIDPVNAFKKIDVIFNATHGESGEDLKLQRALDIFNIPYTGSGHLAALFSNHQGHEKNILKSQGIRMPVYKIFKKEIIDTMSLLDIWKSITNPSLIRPAVSNTAGVSIVRIFSDLKSALSKAFEFSPEIIIEESVAGREAACGILEQYRGDALYSLLPAELVFSKDTDRSVENIFSPGRFSEIEKMKIKDMAKKIHEVLGLRHYSQSHFVVSPTRGIYFLGVDTLPSLSPDSAFGKSIDSVGLSLEGFLDHSIKLALSSRRG